MSIRKESLQLRVNLRSGDIKKEFIPVDDIDMYLGGRIFGAKLLCRELPGGIDPLGPENKLLISAGPLTGSMAPFTSRYVIQTKSPQTGLYLCTLSGGHFGPALKRAGCDMLIIEGVSQTPVYLLIEQEDIKIKDASHLWGMTTGDTQALIKEENKDSALAVACIGPAGERLVPFASVINERRAAGRGGAGAVMGSKNLKAVAVRGTRKMDPVHPRAFQDAVKHIYLDTKHNAHIAESFRLFGSHSAFSALTAGGIIPWRNWQSGGSVNAEALFPENWRDKFVKKDVRCASPCNFKCGKVTLATEGPHAGILSEGPDYETVYSFGTSCDITDFSAIIEADALCDSYGLDTISMGLSIAFAMECFEKGIIGKDTTEGLELRFGASRLLRELIHATAYREGFGRLLSMGTKKMSHIFGGGSEAFAMQVKGMEIGGYDPRGAKSVALIYACGPRGGCHKSNGSANAQSRLELQSGDTRYSNEGKAIMTKEHGDRRMISDSLVFCVFAHGAISDEATVEALNAFTGLDYSVKGMYQAAERGSTLERMFNVREGLTREWDTLPDRLLYEKPANGPNANQTVELKTLIDDYYQLCEWDLKTGIPKREKLEALGLGWVG
jgi:aldehyde:ferredoxin oxidoreductase